MIIHALRIRNGEIVADKNFSPKPGSPAENLWKDMPTLKNVTYEYENGTTVKHTKLSDTGFVTIPAGRGRS